VTDETVEKLRKKKDQAESDLMLPIGILLGGISGALTSLSHGLVGLAVLSVVIAVFFAVVFHFGYSKRVEQIERSLNEALPPETESQNKWDLQVLDKRMSLLQEFANSHDPDAAFKLFEILDTTPRKYFDKTRMLVNKKIADDAQTQHEWLSEYSQQLDELEDRFI